MKLRTRIWILITAALVSLVVVAGMSLHTLRSTMMQDREARLHMLVNLANGALEKMHQKELSGELTREEAQRQAKLVIGSFHKKEDYFFIRDYQSDVLLVHPNPKRVGTTPDADAIKKGNEYRDSITKSKNPEKIGFIITNDGTRPGVQGKVPKLMATTHFAPWGWLMGIGDYIDDIQKEFWQSATVLLTVISVLLTLITLLAMRIARSIRLQLGGEPQYASEIALSIAHGDLSQRIQIDGQVESMLGSMQTMQEGLRQMVERVGKASRQLTTSARELTHQMDLVSQGSQQSSEATASTAAAVEQMTVSINHISDSARETELNSQAAADLATQGEQLAGTAAEEIRRIAGDVSSAADLIRGLVERSREIDSMSAVIKEIADQTNLLALNAAIEAARAGEQGRGFAVVADEVRKLAERTAGATQDITRTIRAVQADTDTVAGRMDEVRNQVTVGVNLTEQAADALREINQGARASLAKSREVAGAASEQSQASNSIAINIERIAQMVEESNAAVQAAHHQVAQLNQLAGELQQEASNFRL